MTQPHIPILDIQPLRKFSHRCSRETDDAQQISINQGTTTRFDACLLLMLKRLWPADHIAFRELNRPNPIEIHLLERHPIGSQAFMPLSQHEWLVVVAHGNVAGDAPDFSTLACFKATGIQGVSYNRGTWHHPLLLCRHLGPSD